MTFSNESTVQEEMEKKVEKWQEPPPAKQTKVLPVPDMEPKKRRGGRRHRKMKERYGLTGVALCPALRPGHGLSSMVRPPISGPSL